MVPIKIPIDEPLAFSFKPITKFTFEDFSNVIYHIPVDTIISIKSSTNSHFNHEIHYIFYWHGSIVFQKVLDI